MFWRLEYSLRVIAPSHLQICLETSPNCMATLWQRIREAPIFSKVSNVLTCMSPVHAYYFATAKSAPSLGRVRAPSSPRPFQGFGHIAGFHDHFMIASLLLLWGLWHSTSILEPTLRTLLVPDAHPRVSATLIVRLRRHRRSTLSHSAPTCDSRASWR